MQSIYLIEIYAYGTSKGLISETICHIKVKDKWNKTTV